MAPRNASPASFTTWRVGLIAVLVVFGPGAIQLAWLSWRQHLLDRKLQTLQTLHENLVKEHDRLTADPVYVEGLIRSTFKVAKPGEVVVPLDSDEKSRKAR